MEKIGDSWKDPAKFRAEKSRDVLLLGSWQGGSNYAFSKGVNGEGMRFDANCCPDTGLICRGRIENGGNKRLRCDISEKMIRSLGVCYLFH
jgi:hypothetical protein